jgi:predicted kinase
MARKPTLHVFCGKLASVKTTLAGQVAKKANAVLVSEDAWLATLFPGEITSFADYLDRSAYFRKAIAPHIIRLLQNGTSVVFDFGGNTLKERAWVRSLCKPYEARIVLHYVKASDEFCKRQLQERNEELPIGTQPTSDAEFDEITKFFMPPESAEKFEIVEYSRKEEKITRVSHPNRYPLAKRRGNK